MYDGVNDDAHGNTTTHNRYCDTQHSLPTVEVLCNFSNSAEAFPNDF